MAKPYKQSRELGRSKKEDSIEEDLPEEVELGGKYFILNGYVGDAKEMVLLKSTIAREVEEIEQAQGKKVVAMILLEDGSTAVLLEDK